MANNEKIDVSRWVDGELNLLRPDCEWSPDAAKAFSLFRERNARKNRNKYKLAWATFIFAAASAALLAHPSSRVLAQRCIVACQNLFATKSESVVLSVSEMAPDFALKDSFGNEVRLSDYRGKVVLLNFWASWCPPCKVEIPWFQEFARSYADQGFEAVGVAMDEDGWTTIKPYIEKLKVDYPIVLGNEGVAKQYGADNLPMTFLIDPEGKVIAKHIGIIAKNDYEAEIWLSAQRQRQMKVSTDSPLRTPVL